METRGGGFGSLWGFWFSGRLARSIHGLGHFARSCARWGCCAGICGGGLSVNGMEGCGGR